MKYGFMGAFVKLAFAKTAFSYLEQQLPNLDMASYRRRVLAEYKAIVARTPSVGTMRDNMFAMTMYAGAFFIALYKTGVRKAECVFFQNSENLQFFQSHGMLLRIDILA